MARGRRYPWTVLGIDATDDKRAIKKAYAAALKTRRPEDDMEKFQELVAARDQALNLASFKSQEDEDDAEQYVLEGSERPGQSADDPATDRLEAEVDEDIDEVDLADDDLASESEETETFDEQDKADIEAHHALQQKTVDPIRRFLESDTPIEELEGAETALYELGLLPMDQKRRIESDLLETVSEKITDVMSDGIGTGGRVQMVFAPKKWLIKKLDEEFGWTEDDRRLQHFWLENETFADQLQLLINPERRRVFKAMQGVGEMTTTQRWFGGFWLFWIAAWILLKLIAVFAGL